MTEIAMPRLTATRRLVAAVGGAAIVVVVGAVTYSSLRREREARNWVAHSHAVIEETQTLFSSLQDAETGQRGYLLTGASSYLLPYEHAVQSLALDTAALRHLTADNERQQRKLDTLSALITSKLGELDSTIVLMRTQGIAAARDLVQTNRGKFTMDSIRAILGRTEVDERSLLAARENEEVRQGRIVLLVLGIGTVAAALIGLFVSGLLTGYASAQETAAIMLDEQNVRLREQTLELRLQQERLQDQAAELEVQNEQLGQQATELELQATNLQEQAAELEMGNEELRRSADALAERTREAERASAAKSEFLTAMSHELRTPLNAIGGYVDLMTMGVRGPITDVQREDLRRIKRSGTHLLSLINEILDLARIDSGRVDLRLTKVPIVALLRDVATLIAPQMDGKELTYTVTPTDPGLVACADADKVQQILLNLLTNAYKFTDSGGRITVEADGDARNGAATTVRIRVTDSGRGIPADRLADIFEPFVQIDRRLTPEGQQGVGLGLAISRDLARAMQGDLAVESVLGKGSTFTLTLPAARST